LRFSNVLLLFTLSIFFSTTVSASLDIDFSGINVTLLNQQPDPVSPGDTLEVRFAVERVVGPNPIHNIDFVIKPEFPFSLVDGDDGIRSVNVIRAKAKNDQGATLFYRLKVSPDASEGTEDLTLSYSDGTFTTTLDPFDIQIQSQDAMIIVENITTNPFPTKPGIPTATTIHVRNTASSYMRNVRLHLEVEKSSFAPYQTGNEISIRSIPPLSTSSATFNLIAEGDSPSTIHEIPLRIDYEDEAGNTFSRNTTIGLIINDPPSYIIGIEESNVVQPATTDTIVLSLSNTGTADMKFVVLSILPHESYEVLSTDSIYIGNIEPDDFETTEVKIHANKNAKSSIPLQISLSYRDNFNKGFEEFTTLDLSLFSKEEVSRYQLKEVPSKVGSIVGALVLILILVFIAFMILDWQHNRMPRYKKILWLITIITGIGAVLYYFMARRTKER